MLFYNHKCLLMTILHSQSSLVTKYFVIIRTLSLCLVISVVSDSATLWTVAHQAPLSMEFSRQEYWSGLSFLSPGDLPTPGIKPTSPAFPAGRILYHLSHLGGLIKTLKCGIFFCFKLCVLKSFYD